MKTYGKPRFPVSEFSTHGAWILDDTGHKVALFSAIIIKPNVAGVSKNRAWKKVERRKNKLV